MEGQEITLEFPYDWTGILRDLGKMKTYIKVTKVLWEVPKEDYMKYNVDGATLERSGAI